MDFDGDGVVSHEEVVASMKDPHAARMAAYDRARRVTYEVSPSTCSLFCYHVVYNVEEIDKVECDHAM